MHLYLTREVVVLEGLVVVVDGAGVVVPALVVGVDGACLVVVALVVVDGTSIVVAALVVAVFWNRCVSYCFGSCRGHLSGGCCRVQYNRVDGELSVAKALDPEVEVVGGDSAGL